MNIKAFFRAPLLLLSVLLSTASYAETVWIDVRSAVEYSLDHIEGDLRIGHTDIVQRMHQLHPDLNTDIRLYCRSGGRAGKAMSALKAAGYKQVSNAGGINHARIERGLNQ